MYLFFNREMWRDVATHHVDMECIELSYLVYWYDIIYIYICTYLDIIIDFRIFLT